MSLVLTGVLANASLRSDRRHLQQILDAPDLPLPELLDQVFGYVGAHHADLMARIAARISKAAADALSAGQSPFKRDGSLQDCLLPLLPEQSRQYLRLVPNDDAAKMRLLAEGPNVHKSSELPTRINRRLDNPVCPSFTAYKVDRQRLFVGPQGFAVFDPGTREAIQAATSRAYGDALLKVDAAPINFIPVLVQDIFNGMNFSHFLFDWMTRAMVFAASSHFDPQRHVFVFGGMPNRFHDIIIEGFKTAFGLTDLNIFFPASPVAFDCLNGVVFFSDNVVVSAHPAQMGREETVTLLRRLITATPVDRPTGAGRIYISRGDAGRRMLRNEQELFGALKTLGFEAVRMADHSIEKQIAMISSAECVVGAHGMGLTHMVFHPGRLKVVELFNPEIGTDTYAIPAKALGFDYHPVIGSRVEDSEDFTIDVDAVLDALKDLPPRQSATQAEPSRRLEDDLSHWFGGVQRIKATQVDVGNLPHPGSPLFVHLRSVDVKDSNVGWWEVNDLSPGQIYRLSCSILIPADFAGDSVTLSVSSRASVSVDTTVRDKWQRVSITQTCQDNETSVNLILRLSSQTDTSMFSCDWQVNSGLF